MPGGVCTPNGTTVVTESGTSTSNKQNICSSCTGSSINSSSVHSLTNAAAFSATTKSTTTNTSSPSSTLSSSLLPNVTPSTSSSNPPNVPALGAEHVAGRDPVGGKKGNRLRRGNVPSCTPRLCRNCRLSELSVKHRNSSTGGIAKLSEGWKAEEGGDVAGSYVKVDGSGGRTGEGGEDVCCADTGNRLDESGGTENIAKMLVPKNPSLTLSMACPDKNQRKWLPPGAFYSLCGCPLRIVKLRLFYIADEDVDDCIDVSVVQYKLSYEIQPHTRRPETDPQEMQNKVWVIPMPHHGIFTQTLSQRVSAEASILLKQEQQQKQHQQKQQQSSVTTTSTTTVCTTTTVTTSPVTVATSTSIPLEHREARATRWSQQQQDCAAAATGTATSTSDSSVARSSSSSCSGTRLSREAGSTKRARLTGPDGEGSVGESVVVVGGTRSSGPLCSPLSASSLSSYNLYSSYFQLWYIPYDIVEPLVDLPSLRTILHPEMAWSQLDIHGKWRLSDSHYSHFLPPYLKLSEI
eukprot:GHVQ01035528.1.p1 GENE.GHVQ01035528.1~~GHVQ01035528.1.p1  ORF type:complete len:569 (+),score=104.66 GHVQ01035528.1:147-1709(+)